MKKFVLLLVFVLGAGAVPVLQLRAQDLPAISVYATGSVSFDDAKAVGTFITAALVNSGRYRGIERPDAFMTELNNELLAYSGSGENPASVVGRLFGVSYVCVAEIAPVLDAYQISAYIMEVERSGIVYGPAEAVGAVSGVNDLMALSERVVAEVLRKPTAAAAAPPVEEPAEAAPEPAAYSPPVSSYGAPDSWPAVQIQTAAADDKPAKKKKKKKIKMPKDDDYEPPLEHGRWRSWGGGGFFASDFGGGVKWRSGDHIAMPYYGWGWYLFFDARYAEFFAGYSGGGGKWGAPDGTSPYELPDMRRNYLNIGAFVKYPIDAAPVAPLKYFPLLGIDYELSVHGEVVPASGYVYEFDGKNDSWRGRRPGPTSLSALWFKFGGGVDYDVGASAYVRGEVLYGWRTGANGYESNLIHNRLAYNSPGGYEGTLAGHGLSLKLGLGLKF